MSQISSKAEIHKNAIIGNNVSIGAFTVIGENVSIGDDTVIDSNAHISGWTDIGKKNRIHHGASIGDEPQDLSYKGEKSFVEIGDNNIFREFTSIHRGTEKGTKTIIQNDCLFMVYSHVGHNSVVKDKVIMVNSTSLGGFVTVEDSVFISAIASVHQFCKIGRYVMVAPNTKVGKDVPPFMMVSEPTTSVIRGMNIVGLRRAGINNEDRDKIKQAYKTLYHEGLSVKNAVQAMKDNPELNSNPFVLELIEFIENSERGICAHYRK
jgi:UDP-N-acetylglucosamine acyltransferase